MYLLIDIGGTKTLIALANQYGKILHSFKYPTIAEEKLFAKNLIQQINTHFAISNICVISVAAPGIIKNNIIQETGNLPWKKFNLAKILHDTYSVPVFIENDANLAGLAEAKRCSGRSVYLTFSTGIGGGVIDNQELNPDYLDFEPGHKIYSYQKKRLEWEDLAAAKPFRDKYNMNVQDIKDRKFWNTEVPEKIALGLFPIILELKPDRIIFGGPIGFELKRYRAPLKRILKEQLNEYLSNPNSTSDTTANNTFSATTKTSTKTIPPTIPRFIVAKHGEFSVIQGCYLYAKTQLANK